jgi:arginase
MTAMRLQLVTVPYRYDAREEGLGRGPKALVEAGLAARLAATGHEVTGPAEAVLDPTEREPGRTAVNIGRLGARTAALVAAARRAGDGALVLAGDDTAAIGVLSGVQLADGDATPIGVVWLDAHGDFNTPETSYSGILAGMPLAILAGLAGPLWREAAGLAATVPTDRLLLAGIRDLDEQEATLLRSTDARIVGVQETADGPALGEAVARLADRCTHLCLHVDLDVLDPHLVPSASTPSAGGLEVDEAAAAMATVLRTGRVATVCLSSLNPGAGKRGERSLASALALLEQALVAWERCPPPPPAVPR